MYCFSCYLAFHLKKYLQYSIDITTEQSFKYMEFIDAKIWIFKNASLCWVFANRVTISNVLLELNKFISILDKRDKNQKKKRRILATATPTAVPQNAPTWVVNSPVPAVVPISDVPNLELVPMITSHVSD